MCLLFHIYIQTDFADLTQETSERVYINYERRFEMCICLGCYRVWSAWGVPVQLTGGLIQNLLTPLLVWKLQHENVTYIYIYIQNTEIYVKAVDFMCAAREGEHEANRLNFSDWQLDLCGQYSSPQKWTLNDAKKTETKMTASILKQDFSLFKCCLSVVL